MGKFDFVRLRFSIKFLFIKNATDCGPTFTRPDAFLVLLEP